jgi:hypothetical protein
MHKARLLAALLVSASVTGGVAWADSQDGHVRGSHGGQTQGSVGQSSGQGQTGAGMPGGSGSQVPGQGQTVGATPSGAHSQFQGRVFPGAERDATQGTGQRQFWHGQTQGWHGQSQGWPGQAHDWHGQPQSWHGETQVWHGQPQGWHGQPQNWHGRPGMSPAWHAQARFTFAHHRFDAFSPIERERWVSGRWEHSWHHGRWGWWWYAGGAWYFYNAPVYPYPEIVADTYYEDDSDSPDNYGPGPDAMWYYCDRPQGYYPYVQDCRDPWQPVPAGQYQGPGNGPGPGDYGPPPDEQGGPYGPPPPGYQGDPNGQDGYGQPPPGYQNDQPTPYGPPPGPHGDNG